MNRTDIESNSEIMSWLNNERQPYEITIAQNCYFAIYEDTFTPPIHHHPKIKYVLSPHKTAKLARMKAGKGQWASFHKEKKTEIDQ